MNYIDTHCHLQHTMKKGAKLNDILEHAKKAGVIAIIDSPVFANDYSNAIRIHRSHPQLVFVTAGLSPANYHELDIDYALERIRFFAENGEIVGIGEVGLDYYWVKDQKTRLKQHETFARFVALANELRLPLVIHSRDAEAEALPILAKRNEGVEVVMHSFGGTVETALQCIDSGYYISIPTCVTTRKKHRDYAKRVPLEQLVIETDAPYLSPFPEDRTRNEPAYVRFAAKEIAKIKGLPEEDVARVTTENAKKIFKLPLP